MGDLTIAQDLLEGVAEALGTVGNTRTLKLITYGAIDIDNPGAAPTRLDEDVPIDALLFDFEQEYMPKANVLEGSTMAILSIIDLTDVQVSEIIPGNKLVDGTETFEIISALEVEASGVPVTFIIQLKG